MSRRFDTAEVANARAAVDGCVSVEHLVPRAWMREREAISLVRYACEVDSNNNWFAAWGAWVLDVYGFGERVKLLDGGRKLWEARKLPLTAEVPSFKASNIELPERDNSLRARLTNVLDVVEGRIDGALIDIRSPDEYLGKIFAPEGVKELSIRAGHIPGAENVPWATIVNEDGTYKPLDEIRRIYADKGVDGSKPVTTYCRIGERSSHTWFVLKYLQGFESVRNYDGSWTEWGNAVRVPIATGEQPGEVPAR